MYELGRTGESWGELGGARNTNSSGGLGLQKFKNQFTWKPTENF